jgi:hypothetical protein
VCTCLVFLSMINVQTCKISLILRHGQDDNFRRKSRKMTGESLQEIDRSLCIPRWKFRRILCVCTGIKTMGVKINFHQFPTGYDIFSGFYVLSVRHPNKKYFPLLHLCTGLKPFGVYVN